MGKAKANNLVFDSVRPVAVAAFADVADIGNVIGDKPLPWPIAGCTHVAGFRGWSINLLQEPGVDAGFEIQMSAASAVGRPPSSEALYCNGDFYYRLSFNDIGVVNAGRGLKLVRSIGGRKLIIQFYRKEEDPDRIKLLMAAMPVQPV